MKTKYYSLLCLAASVLITISLLSFRPAVPTGFKIKPGTELVYSVAGKSGSHKLTVKIDKAIPDMLLTYTEEIGKTKKTGHITITQMAMQQASGISTRRTGNVSCTDRTCFWLSQAKYHEWTDIASLSLKVDDSDKISLPAPQVSTEMIPVNGNPIAMTAISGTEVLLAGDEANAGAEGPGRVIKVLNDPNNPLILYLDLGTPMELKEVRNAILQ